MKNTPQAWPEKIALVSGIILLLAGCSLFDAESDGRSPAQASPLLFGNIQVGATWRYAISWIRSGDCTGDRIRNITLEDAVPRGASTLLIYQWSEYEKGADSTRDFRSACDSVDAGIHYDSVYIDSDSHYQIPDTLSDEKKFRDLEEMSFFQIKRIPSDTQLTAVCAAAQLRLAASVTLDGRSAMEIIDTTACLNGLGDSVSFVEYRQGVGLVKKEWGYRDEGVIIDYTWIRLLEFNGRNLDFQSSPNGN